MQKWGKSEIERKMDMRKRREKRRGKEGMHNGKRACNSDYGRAWEHITITVMIMVRLETFYGDYGALGNPPLLTF